MANQFTAGVQHIGIPTNDMNSTIGFYKTLGFEIVHEAAADCRVVFLKLDNLVIEAYENHQAVMKNGAVDHIALDTTDIDAAYAFAKKSGLKLTGGGGIESLPFWSRGVKFFKVEGPNCETIEFCQIL
ncbi:MAG: VOC family protein [Treponema sp.]|jgi:catechol 2,3-dioxygenase-like lactoylglutathione lyase family enzyme|nr:VOC family protein [Treponema sp.]